MFHRKFLLALLPAAILSAQTPAPKTPPGTPAPKPAATDAGQPAVSPDKVVLTIGDTKYTAAQYQNLVLSFPEAYRQAALGPQKRAFIEDYLRMKLLANEARKRNLQDKPEVKSQLAFASDTVLAGQAFSDLTKNLQVTDAEIKKYYDEHKAEFEQAKAAHILIRYKGSPVPLKAGQKDLTEEEALAKAQDIKKKLTAGGDFAKLAREESDDTSSGAVGGDLGFFPQHTMVGPFDDTVFKMTKGQISEPVKTQFGYHIIKLEDRRSEKLEEVKQRIEAKLKPEAAKRTIDDLRKSSSVTVDDAFFGPPLPSTPAPVVR